LRPERPTDNPQGQTLGDFDLSFAVIYLYPLVILALGFNLITAEKESGTLSLVLAQPVRFRTLLLGKIAVRALLIFAFGILLPAVLMLVGWLVVGAEINFALLVVWMLATSLYCVFWFALAAVINARGRTAAANALALAVCWLVFVVLVPAVAGIVVETLAPVPSPVEFADAEREARLAATLLIDAPRDEVRDAREKRYRADYNDKAGQERRTRGIYEEPMELPNDRRLLVEFFSQHPQISPTQTTLQLLYIFSEIRNERIEADIAPLLEKTSAGRERRESYAQISRFFSPSILLQNIFQNITDAGDSRQRRFLAQLDDHIRGLNNRLKEKILRNQSVTATDIKNLAPFQYREAATGEILERSAISLLMLIVLSALASFLAFNAFRNRSVVD
jgi:ABC-2 type transport system permease protein